MTRGWRKFGDDRRGVAAIEFAFILPILAMVLILGVDGWLRITHANDMRTALSTGSRYYLTGGGDDATAKTVALSAWQSRPTAATLTVARACLCGTTPTACSTACSGSATPTTQITLSAQATYPGLVGSTDLSDQQVVRVR